MKPKVCVLGSVNLDLVVQTTVLPKAGETIGGGSYKSMPGGKGANVALVLQRLGADTELRAAIGQDDYALEALANLKQAGVALDNLTEKKIHTGLAFINVADDGENQIAVASGANGEFSPDDLMPINADAIISQFEIPGETILKAFQSFDGFKVLNASPVSADLSVFMPMTDLIIVNETEYAAYEPALSKFAAMLAVTHGANGAILYHANQEIARAEPPKVTAIDTTGAGDAFAAALTLALVEKQSPQQALEFACHVGALTTTRLGAQGASPSRSDLS